MFRQQYTDTSTPQSIYRRHKVFLLGGFVVVLFFFLVPVDFACCWDPGELSSAAGVNTYHIMHSTCNTIPLSLSVQLVTSMLTEVEMQTK